MNKAEFKAISIIADKLNWHNKPVMEVCETIKQMVRNQQALELDCIGECDGDEETLLSIALWSNDKIRSTMFVTDYCSLQEWSWNLFCEDMGITSDEMNELIHWYNIKSELLAEEYELEEMAMYDAYCNRWETLIAKTMKKLEKILYWFFDSDWGFLILILSIMGLMWLLWSLHWEAIYNK